MVVAVLAGLIMLVPAWQLYMTRDRKDSRRLMFRVFIYLPVVQLAYVLDKV